MRPFIAVACALGLTHLAPAHAAIESAGTGSADWIPWLLLGGIALLVLGIALKMVFAARFSKGYGAWARSRRDTFAARNEQWDGDDERR